MKDDKLNKLFAAARRDATPQVPADFAEKVRRHLEPIASDEPVVVNLWEQLNRGFTRYAIAAAAMIVICATIEISQHFSHDSDLDDDVQQICSDWMSR